MEERVWKHMYLKLAGSVADAVEVIHEPQVKQILIRGMQDAEEIYIGVGDSKAAEESRNGEM